MRTPSSLVALLAAALCFPASVRAQAGPPFLTNDPGTPGNGNWEINLGSAQLIQHGAASYQVPQFDLNFGVGERIQLTYQVPYVIVTSPDGSRETGWGNAYPGVKWRFLDQGEDGWQVSTFAQLETGVSASAAQRGIGATETRVLLPLEASRQIGPVGLDLEAGYYLPKNGRSERTLGLVMGHSFSRRLELDAELYDDRATQGAPHYTLLDVGGRFKLSRGFIALFMAGRSLSGTGDGQPELNGYLGIQILLSDYGLALSKEP